jgi:hypothetical protein
VKQFWNRESGNWNGRICMFQLGKEVPSYNLKPMRFRWKIDFNERQVEESKSSMTKHSP